MRSIAFATAILLASAAASAQTLPIADAGEDQEFPCAPAAGAQVTLDGTGSSDPDSATAALTYTWTGAALGGEVTGATPVVVLPPGVHELTLTVDDGVDGTATDTVQVTVVADVTPPTLTVGTPAVELWPPNHKYHALDAADFGVTASDDCDVETGPEDVVFVSGTSDEAENGNGDGNTTGDVSFENGCSTAMVRSERAGPEDGRVYELTLTLHDAAGNAAEVAVVTASVPHSKKSGAVDSGDAYEVIAEACGPVELCGAAPAEVCTATPAAEVAIKVGRKGDPSLRWRARGFAAAAGAFDDPATDYQLCVYTDDGVTPALATAPAAARGSLWKRKDGKASYRAPKGADGIRRLELAESGGTGEVAAEVSSADLPALPLDAGTALVLQLMDSSGGCLGSRFDAPKKNDADRYQAAIPAD